jgi:poly(ADP-ribose) glycohydrolase ARH3
MGCAIGDVLGIAFESGRTRLPPSSWPATTYPLPSPRWTDDTQQSLVLADEVLRFGVLDPRRVMQRFVAMRDDPGSAAVGPRGFGLHRGTGQGFRHAVDAFARTAMFAPMPGRCGNGAAMRVTAVAVALGDSDASRAQLDAVSRATHDEETSLHAAAAIALAAWALARGRRGDDVIDEVVDRLDVGAVQTTLRDARRANNPLAVIGAAGQHATGGRLRGGAGDGHALCSPLSALFLAVRAPSLHEALRQAVLLGGDTDSTAAIAGALRASIDGIDDLPPALRDFPGAVQLRRWGDPIMPTLDEWLALERSLTPHHRA